MQFERNIRLSDFCERVQLKIEEQATRAHPYKEVVSDYKKLVGAQSKNARISITKSSAESIIGHYGDGSWYQWLLQAIEEKELRGLRSKLDEETLRGLSKGNGDIRHAMSVHYRFHMNAAGDLEYADTLDRFVFGRPLRELGEAVFLSSEAAKHNSPPFRLVQPSLSSQTAHFTQRTVELLGREKEIDALHEFRDEPGGFKWVQISGVAGQGKSRLALEFWEETKRLEGWTGGFWSSADWSAEKMAELDKALAVWQPTKNTVIVFDDIIGAGETLRILVRGMLSRSKSFKRSVRLVIVERQPWDHGHRDAVIGRSKAHWYSELTDRRDGFDSELENARFCVLDQEFQSTINLKMLSLENLEEIVQRLVSKNKPLNSPDGNEIREMLIGLGKDARPLYAHLMAKAIVHGRLDVCSETYSLLDWVLSQDRRERWAAYFGGEPPELGDDPLEPDGKKNPCMRLAVLATMLDHVEHTALGDGEDWIAADSQVRRQVAVICDRYVSSGPSKTQLQGLSPNILGEWFVLRSIEAGIDISWLAETGWQISGGKMAAFLRRCVDDFGTLISCKDLVGYIPKDVASKNNYGSFSPTILEGYYLGKEIEPDSVPRNLLFSAAFGGEGDLRNNINRLALVNSLGLSSYTEKAFRKGVISSISIAAIRNPGAYSDSDLVDLASLNFDNRRTFGSLQKARELLDIAVDRGGSTALFLKGLNEFWGVYERRNFSLAYDCFSRSHSLGLPNATNSLGVCIFLGRGIDQSHDEAFGLFREANERKCPHGGLNVGLCQFFGTGTQKNIEQGLDAVIKASREGLPTAMLFEALLLHKGRYVKKDTVKAKALIKEMMANFGEGSLSRNRVRLMGTLFACIHFIPSWVIFPKAGELNFCSMHGSIITT